jgi:outer membrane protein assembly factor BamB
MKHRMRITVGLIATGFILLLVAGATVARADWNTGVGRSSTRTSLAPEVGPVAADLLWQGSRPSLVAQQGICAGNLLVLNRIQSFTIPTGDWIVAHDLTTGAELWRAQLPFVSSDEWRSRATAIRDGHVYATRSGGAANPSYLYALDPADGSILWRSVDRISESTTESAAMAANGDLIIGSFAEVIRINRNDGTTVWRTPRSSPTDDGSSVVVFGNRVYTWEASGQGPKVTAFDLTTGARLYSSAALSAGLIQQIGLMVGSDGTVYAPRSMNNPATDYFVALTDTGTSFLEKWRYPMGFTPFASFGIGPDGTVYTYSRSQEIVRLDPEDGGILNTSPRLTIDNPFSPRMGIDGNGKVYLTNGGFIHGMLYSFNADLTLRWSINVPSVNIGGPVIGQTGILVVCGVGTDVRAFRSSLAGIGDPAARRYARLEQNAPNPFRAMTRISFDLPQPSRITLSVYDAAGGRVLDLINGELRSAGHSNVTWDGCDGRGTRVPAGVYFYRLQTDIGAAETRRMVLQK